MCVRGLQSSPSTSGFQECVAHLFHLALRWWWWWWSTMALNSLNLHQNFEVIEPSQRHTELDTSQRVKARLCSVMVRGTGKRGQHEPVRQDIPAWNSHSYRLEVRAISLNLSILKRKKLQKHYDLIATHCMCVSVIILHPISICNSFF